MIKKRERGYGKEPKESGHNFKYIKCICKKTLEKFFIKHDEGYDKVFVKKRINITGYRVDILHYLTCSMDNDKLIH